MLPIATVAWSACLCVLGTRVSCAKIAELIEMPFGQLTREGPMNHILDGVQIPHRKGTFVFFFGGGACVGPAHCNVPIRMNVFRIVRLPPRANMPAQRTRRTNVSAAARGDKTTMRPFAKLL